VQLGDKQLQSKVPLAVKLWSHFCEKFGFRFYILPEVNSNSLSCNFFNCTAFYFDELL